MPGRKRRSRRRSRRGGAIFEDAILIELPVGTTVTYRSTDVRVNNDRPYAITRAVAHLCVESGKDSGVVQLRLLDPRFSDTNKTVAVSGPITVGAIPKRVFVRAPRGAPIWIDPTTQVDLLAVDELCTVKADDIRLRGTLRISIRLGNEMFHDACPTVMRARTLTGRPEASPQASSSWTDIDSEKSQ